MKSGIMKSGVTMAMMPLVPGPSPNAPRQALVNAPRPIPHHGVPAVMTSRARAVDDVAAAGAVAGGVAAARRAARKAVKWAVTGRFPEA